MSLVVAQTDCWKPGRACPLCPGISDINLFRYGQSIVDFDSEVSDRAFDFGVAKQKLDSPEITCAPVDQGSFCASEGVRPEQPWVESNAADPLGNEARILPRCHAGLGPRRPVNKNSPGLLLAAFR
jgi:hypothetical protein